MQMLFKLLSTCKKVSNLVKYNKHLSNFPSLMALSYSNGNQYHSDADFISHRFNVNIDAYGNKKIRHATISQEKQQRATCLTEIAEGSTQAKRLEEIDCETRRGKKLLIKSKMYQKLSEDQTVITKFCAMMELEMSEDNVGRCKLKCFDKLKAAKLKAFIVACYPKYMKVLDIAHLQNPRGGKSMEEVANGAENCISIAFGVRS
jgi:hypothetical protein